VFLCAAAAACATDGISGDSDAGDETPPPYTYDGSSNDSTAFEAGAFETSSDFETSVGDGPQVLDDGSACNPLKACDPNQGPLACPFFFICQEALWDSGPPDAGDAGPDADAAPPPAPKGMCMPVFEPMRHCANGIDHCDAGEQCLVGSQRCLTAAEVACICANPATQAACGPP
jgi:hypothetical protein